jgi:hypothetical protein
VPKFHQEIDKVQCNRLVQNDEHGVDNDKSFVVGTVAVYGRIHFKVSPTTMVKGHAIQSIDLNHRNDGKVAIDDRKGQKTMGGKKLVDLLRVPR